MYWIATRGKTLQSKEDTVDKASWLRFRRLRRSLCGTVGFFFCTELKVDTDTFCVTLNSRSLNSAVKLFHSTKLVERGCSNIKHFKVVEYDPYNSQLLLGKL